MKKKGFTLIELLAVIVILAIITVIAVPKILSVIEKSEEQSFLDSAKLIENGIKTQLGSSDIIGEDSFIKGEDNCYLFDFTNKNDNYTKLKVKNKENYTGKIKYCNNKFIYTEFSNGKYTLNTDDEGNKTVNKIGKIETKYYEIEELIRSVSSNTNDLGTITSDSIYGTQHDSYYAFNGIASGTDKWLNQNTTGGWLKWNFKEAKKISKFYIHGSDMSNRTPSSVELLGSNDDENYISLVNSQLIEMHTDGSKEIIVPKEKQDYYKYYKWNFSSNYGGSYGIAVGEIEVYTITKYELGKGDIKVTLPYLTSNDSLTADSIYPSHDPYCVFDGISDSKWLNQNVDNGWLIRKFDINVKISEFKIYGTDLPNRTPKTVELLGSNDGENYILISSSELEQKDFSGYNVVSIPEEKQSYYKYYKWNFPNGNYGGNVGIAIGEIELTTYIK